MPRQAPAVFDLVGQIAAAGSVSIVWQCYMAAARQAGFHFGLTCLVHTHSPLSARVLGVTMPENWLSHYAQQDYATCNPVAERARTATRPFSWRIADWDVGKSRPLQHWRDDTMSAGITHGLIMPSNVQGETMAISLVGDRDDIDPHDRTILHFAGQEAMARMRELYSPPRTENHAALSQRERECLQWIAAGKSDWEIGNILSLSEKTVNAYVERAKQKLGARARVQAVIMALREGQIAF